MATVLGIDEAGRGAVLGPLVVAGVLAEETRLSLLWEIGARDSKALPHARRRPLAQQIVRAGFPARVVVISAQAVNGQNLTELELEAASQLIRTLRPRQAILDAPVAPPAIPKFLASLAARSGLARQDLAVLPKADRNHPAVAAASVLAKSVRDAYVLALRREFGDFGWGYPGERAVQEFLLGWFSRHRSLPTICRTRWRNVQELLMPKLVGAPRSCGLSRS